MLIHRGEWDEKDRCHYEVPFDSYKLLERWQAEGCAERFHAVFQPASEVRPSAEVAAELEEFLKIFSDD